MKIFKFIVLLFFVAFLVTACGNITNEQSNTPNTSNTTNNQAENKITSSDDITNKSGTLYCTRSGTAPNATPFFEYTIKYRNDELLELHSVEGITSEDQETLDSYADAYESINSNYQNLKYYDTKVIKNSDSVTRDTTINYAKIDLEELLEIEGTENNIIENGTASLSAWLELASKFGTTCTEQ